MSVAIGQVIDGKYRILRLIGEGGMGSVYEGENLLIRRRVAIKVMHATAAKDADMLRRFEREAQAAGSIGNDHILEVLDLGTLANGDRYMVMEYLDGETLTARIERAEKMSPQDVAPLARQVLSALVSAHAAGIIHRDLKPDNIFVLKAKAGHRDFVKLIDFGIAKFGGAFGTDGIKVTRVGAVIGTPGYISPEQARGNAEADARSDIYALGVILYEAVSGRLPFLADNFNDLMFRIALSDPPPLTTLRPDIDQGFAAIVQRAMAREPDHRFQTAQELADVLDTWMTTGDASRAFVGGLRTTSAATGGATMLAAPGGMASRAVTSMSAAAGSGSGFTPVPFSGTTPNAVSSGTRNKKVVLVALAAVATLVIGAGIGVAASRSSRRATASTYRDSTEKHLPDAPAPPNPTALVIATATATAPATATATTTATATATATSRSTPAGGGGSGSAHAGRDAGSRGTTRGGSGKRSDDDLGF